VEYATKLKKMMTMTKGISHHLSVRRVLTPIWARRSGEPWLEAGLVTVAILGIPSTGLAESRTPES
jgi:hypothetical protein